MPTQPDGAEVDPSDKVLHYFGVEDKSNRNLIGVLGKDVHSCGKLLPDAELDFPALRLSNPFQSSSVKGRMSLQ
jgi:hypothetical protein